MADPQWYDKAKVDALIQGVKDQINANPPINEIRLVSIRRMASDGTYPTTLASQADTTLWWIGTTPPSSSNPAVKAGDIFSLQDASS